MDMPGVAAAGLEDVDPQIVEPGFARQVEVERLGVGDGVPVQPLLQLGEFRQASASEALNAANPGAPARDAS